MNWRITTSLFPHIDVPHPLNVVHNYIQKLSDGIFRIRKGAISAEHGAGRLMSRTKAKQLLDIDTYKNDMDGIYSTCISNKTLDESTRAYKLMDMIISTIDESVDIIDIIKPIYNFKSN